MDFQLYIRVLWRFRLIVAAGFVLAMALALLSMVHVSTSGITYRQNELWSSTMRLLVTQSGFPEGRLYAQVPTAPQDKTGTTGDASTPTGDQTTSGGIPVVDPGRLNSLAIFYAELATSDPVRQLMRRDGPVRGKVIATALKDEQSGTLLPMIDLAAISTSPQAAVMLALRGADALSTFLTAQQRANNVPAADRVVLQTLIQPKGALVFQPRSKTMPIVVFLVIMFGIVALAFLLESLKPRAQAKTGLKETDFADTATQARTA
jgi:hypothetical protein